MANHEDYLDALTAFGRDSTKEIPHILEQYLHGVAKNGETLFQWPLLKPLIVGKMEQVLEELHQGLSSENIISRPNVENVRFDVMRTRIMDAVHKFTGAPFTIQRLCELLIDPRRHYKRSDKFLRGLEKNVLVVSTVDPFGRKVVSESGTKHMVNGMDNGSPFFPRDSSTISNLPPVPDWVTISGRPAASPSPSTHQEAVSPQRSEPQEQSIATNGVTTGFEDQGDQPPPAVHAEEIVETAVSVDTCEVGPDATGAGEALAEEEEEDMGTDDTNASSSSSSSSSSEDFSSSDTGESSSISNTQTVTVVTSSSEPLESRPWAAIVADGESSRQEDQAMEQESSQSTPDTSKDSASDQQDTDTSTAQVLSSSSPNKIDHSNPMDITEASSLNHTSESSAEQAVDSAAITPVSQGDESMGFIPSTDNQVQPVENCDEDVSSSPTSSTSSLPLPAPTESKMSYAEAVSKGEKQGSGGELSTVAEELGKETELTSECSSSANTVTSSQVISLPSDNIADNITCPNLSPSSSQHLQPATQSESRVGDDDYGHPSAAKQRRLSDDSEFSSSSFSDPSLQLSHTANEAEGQSESEAAPEHQTEPSLPPDGGSSPPLKNNPETTKTAAASSIESSSSNSSEDFAGGDGPSSAEASQELEPVFSNTSGDMAEKDNVLESQNAPPEADNSQTEEQVMEH